MRQKDFIDLLNLSLRVAFQDPYLSSSNYKSAGQAEFKFLSKLAPTCCGLPLKASFEALTFESDKQPPTLLNQSECDL